MKDLLIGILLGILCVLAILYGLELKRLDATKADKHKIIDGGVVVLRFAVGGDLHWTQNNPDVSPGGYADRIDALITELEAERSGDGLDFAIFNGDLVHNNPSDLTDLKTALDTLTMPYYVVYGNHDRATEAAWLALWGYVRSHSFVVGDYAFVCPSTSNTSGSFLAIDTTWLQAQINSYADKDGIFVIAHIPQDRIHDTSICPNAPDVRAIFEATENLRAVFYSHLHVQAGSYTRFGVKYFFTGHSAQSGLGYYAYRIVEIA